jgi:hypothetical protein
LAADNLSAPSPNSNADKPLTSSADQMVTDRYASTSTISSRPSHWPIFSRSFLEVIGAAHGGHKVGKPHAGGQGVGRPEGFARSTTAPATPSKPTSAWSSPPHDRIALDRAPNRLEHQEIRPHRAPLPNRADPSRPTDSHATHPLADDLAEALAKITMRTCVETG